MVHNLLLSLPLMPCTMKETRKGVNMFKLRAELPLPRFCQQFQHPSPSGEWETQRRWFLNFLLKYLWINLQESVYYWQCTDTRFPSLQHLSGKLCAPSSPLRRAPSVRRVQVSYVTWSITLNQTAFTSRTGASECKSISLSIQGSVVLSCTLWNVYLKQSKQIYYGQCCLRTTEGLSFQSSVILILHPSHWEGYLWEQNQTMISLVSLPVHIFKQAWFQAHVL